ncbi:unnamed protein product [Toxocara canis]|uniref:Protein-serine/threonine phosphatase n=1 Tax=Toxocara canis TaxID=6265 RepID=A0A183VEF0_TOXCA|nr:unnamed protein product [Toxocara canis]
MNQEDISIDVARCVLVICLPSSLQEESDDAFKEAIYEMLEKTFSVDKEAVEQVLRFPRLDPTSEEFGCKCVIMFRSRMLKHRVIAQKSKLDAPTEVVSILDIPKELVEPEEDLELADESTCDDDVQPGKESASPASPDSQHENIAVGCDASNNAFEADGGDPKLRNDPAVDHPAVGSEQAAAVGGVLSAKCIQRCDPEEDATVSLNDVFIVDAAGSVDSDGKAGVWTVTPDLQLAGYRALRAVAFH